MTYFDSSSKKIEGYFDEIKLLPIRMQDRRDLYKDLLNIYEFENEVVDRGPVQKKIKCFRFCLFVKRWIFYWRKISLWENSIREIEVQRGTLTANVFLFIKWTFYFNLIIFGVVFLIMMLPHILINIYFLINHHEPEIKCPDHFEPNNATSNQITNYEPAVFAECCYLSWLKKANESQPSFIQESTTLKNLRKATEFLVGKNTYLSGFMFYGYYRTRAEISREHRLFLPIMYNIAVLVILAISFCVLVRNIGRGVQEIVRNSESETTVFSDLVFSGFYYRVEDEKDERYRRKLWLHNLRVALKRAKTTTKIKPSASIGLIITRIVIFVGTIVIIGLLGYGIFTLSNLSYIKSDLPEDSEDFNGTAAEVDYVEKIFYSFLPSFIVGLSNIIMPILFIKISKFERYTIEASTALILFRSLSVRLLSIFIALFRILQSNLCVKPKDFTCTACVDKDIRPHNCWESLIAQALYKLIIVEFLQKVFFTFVIDPFRRSLGKCFPESKICRRISTLRFNVIRHSLDIINLQVLSWVGFYFAPGFPFCVCLYILGIFYVKKFSLLHNSVGTPETHRVTRTTTIFQMGELVSFIILTFFLVAVFGNFRGSRSCGPFSEFKYPWESIKIELYKNSVTKALFRNIAQPSIYFPLEVLCVTLLYYFYCLVAVNKTTTRAIKDVIVLETEDKQFLITKLQHLRTQFKYAHFYSPLAIFLSEKSYLVSAAGQRKKDEQALLGNDEDEGTNDNDNVSNVLSEDDNEPDDEESDGQSKNIREDSIEQNTDIDSSKDERKRKKKKRKKDKKKHKRKSHRKHKHRKDNKVKHGDDSTDESSSSSSKISRRSGKSKRTKYDSD